MAVLGSRAHRPESGPLLCRPPVQQPSAGRCRLVPGARRQGSGASGRGAGAAPVSGRGTRHHRRYRLPRLAALCAGAGPVHPTAGAAAGMDIAHHRAARLRFAGTGVCRNRNRSTGMMMSRGILRNALAALLLMLLVACGFQLRGEVELPPELSSVTVKVADAYSPLKRNLEDALARAGARAQAAQGPVAVLDISRNRMSRWPLSVGRTGRVQEFSMRYEVTMQLTDANGEVVVPKQDIQLERAYQFETLQAQGTPGEEEVVRAELERDMTQAILRRISAAVATP